VRYLLIIPLMLVSAAALAQTAADQLTKAVQETQCARPDRALIKVESDGQTSWTSQSVASAKYNRQVKGFNDCTRVYVDNANREITRIRNDAQSQLDQMTGSATGRIHRIERQINDAIEMVKAVNGIASVAPSGPDTAPDAFPEPECKLPDQGLLVPLRRARDNAVRERQYDGQIRTYENCMRGWIAEAKSEISQIKLATESSMKVVTADANRQILQIWDTILDVVKQGDLAQKEQAGALASLKEQLAAAMPAPSASQETETVVSSDVRLPRSADQPTGEGDPDAISCRKAQPLPGLHFMGPEICKRNREWAKFYKRGENLGPDGKQILESEKARTFAPDHCFSHTRFINGVPVTETTCSQSAHGM
jgi:biopolymer transport protein ExbD